MTSYRYGIADFRSIAAGAAVLASGGGGSYRDALTILQQLADSGWSESVTVQPYDGTSNACVLAMMGSPDAGDQLTLTDIQNSVLNTLQLLQANTGCTVGCVIPVEIGAINSLVPLIAAAMTPGSMWVVDGDGAGRAVPELPQTTFSGSNTLPVSPCALATDVADPSAVESALLTASNAAKMESLAGGVVGGFGGFSGIALWPSNPSNGYGLTGSYIPGTLGQAWALGQFLLTATSPPTAADVAAQISLITGRAASVTVRNFYITAISQSTTTASLDAGVIRLDNTPDPATSTQTHTIYNMNENLIMYSSQSAVPDTIAPDSICYYSESTGLGFSNASDDLAVYFDSATGKSTGQTVSIIQVATVPQLYNAPGVLASFASLLRDIGYAGVMPTN
ncbi:hypothetical protein SAMN05216303_1011463 [Rhodoferax sp. OV413]|uniref:S-methyl thiohydantoin desulfurase domain-containing protein n=1 Tax=Rhodoferax sp. OV413 TaxID=1855285 RepID=UPI000887C8F9|nr:DUF917 family protein [Rhodoferax sp. OV413]SDO45977.1 hypothetical protein SAMN05216303_1011463 [Rhodoferax sp. OV413]